jgi:hypothetical protein
MCSINGVFWLSVNGKRPDGLLMVSNVTDRAKRPVPSLQTSIEADLVYPLLRGLDVQAWSAKPELSVLVTHEQGMRLKAIPVDDMQRKYPKAWSYLQHFEKELRTSGSFKRFFNADSPFYSIFDIGDYSFSTHKLVVREIAGGLTCAVAGSHKGKPIIPDHKLILVPFEDETEAHFLCGLLNSSPARLFVDSYVITTQFSPHLFENLAIPDFDSHNKIHRRLAVLSKEAHDATSRGEMGDVARITDEIDHLAATTWNLSDEEMRDVKFSIADNKR